MYNKNYKWTLRHRVPTDSNLLDPQIFTQGFNLNGADVITVDDNYMYSYYVDVVPGQTYQVHSTTGIINTIVFYDLVKEFVSGIFNSPGVDTFVVPAGCYFLRVNATSVSAGQPMDELGITLGAASDFTPYYRSREVQPVYKKMSRGFKIESNQQYYREKLEGNFKLLREDYDYIDAIAFDTRFLLRIEDLNNILTDYNGYFYKTDCKWDADDRAVEIKTKPDDDYSKIVGGLNKTFNLIEVAPELQEITIRRRPVIQVYIPGDTVITNILGGTSWEQEIQIDPEFDDSALVNTYKFFNSKNIRIIPADYATGLSTNVTGEYNANREQVGGNYKLVEFKDDNRFPFWDEYTFYIVPISATLAAGESWEDYALYKTDGTTWQKPSINTLEFYGVNGETGNFYFTEYRVYVRYYTDLLNVRGTNTHPAPNEDIVANNGNYKRVIGYNIDDFYIYDEFVTQPTKFGKVPEGAPNAGEYYKEFLVSVATGLSNPLPISPSNWRAVSLWFFNTLDIRYTEFIDGQDFVLRDAFPLHSVIRRLLEKVGSTVSFLDTTDYSEFLYASTNPLGGFSYLDFDGGTILTNYIGNSTHFITPKSNIVSANYTQPAQKAEATLGQIFNMLRDTYKIYWHVEGNKLRMEHISWYQNGGTYSGINIGADITQLEQPRNGKKWGFNQNKWEFDKEQMSERYEYSWMDDVSKPFEGFNIDILSNYTQEGRVEDLAVQGVTTDVDFIQANPQEVSKSGFVMLSTVFVGGKHRLPFLEMDLGYNQQVIVQNGFLSWLYLHPKYHVYDLPSDRVRVNDVETILYQNNTRQKKQEVSYPASAGINPYQLVVTALGNGIVDKLTLDMSNYIVKATIKHDTT